MEIPVSCSCGKSFRAKSSLAGKTVACPGCKNPIRIPNAPAASPPVSQPPAAQAPAAQAPVAAAPNPSAEILMACGCGQQFKVDSQFAGQQVNCPTCQAVCVIPNPQQAAYPATPAAPMMQQTPMQPPGMQPGMQPAPGMQQPGMQQPGMQQPGMQQPMMGGGYGAVPDYQQPGYQSPGYSMGSRPKTFKTGLGIFIFAIAACVFAGGFGFQRIAEAITEIRIISVRASAKSGNFNFSPSSAQNARTINNITTMLIKIGAIAMLLGMVAIVVGAVFCIMSPSPLMALGITEVCVAAVAGILLSIYEYVPALQETYSTGMGIFASYGLGGNTADKFIGLMIRFSEIATFIIFSIFLIYAIGGKHRRGVYPEQPKVSLITFSIAAGIHLFLVILTSIELKGEWVFYVYLFIRWLAHAAMIVGLIFIIKTSFEAKAVHRI